MRRRNTNILPFSTTSRVTIPLQGNDAYVTLASLPFASLHDGIPGLENVMKMISVLLLAMLVSGCGYSKPMASGPQPGAVPSIMVLSPPNTPAGGSAFILTINGSSFNQDAAVNFGGAHPTTAYVTTNQLTAMIPASAIATSGTVAVTVTNPGHAGGGIYGAGGTTAETSAPMNFIVN
jgi:hypothetical protein